MAKILKFAYIYIYIYISCFEKNTRINQRVSKLVYDYPLELNIHFLNIKK